MTTHEMIGQAYEYCRKVTVTHAKTFYFASIFLPERKRNACYAVYAVCRYIDDLVDRGMGEDGRITHDAVARAIAQWRARLDRAGEGDGADSMVLTAWSDTLNRYGIDSALADTLIEGVMTDLRPSVRFDTFDELYRYCYSVASVVGLMTSEIFGYSDPRARQHAIDLGIAMQLTNILRDVREDFDNGRIYLPHEELSRFGLDEETIASGSLSGSFRSMMKFQIDRAHAYYSSADLGIAMLEPDSRLTVTLMSHNYRRILSVIERNGYDVFSRRASVPLYSKMMTVPVLWYRTVSGR